MPSTPRPLLSLVVPCYAVEAYLPEFIESVDGQAMDAVEVIVVIDGSPDASSEIAHRWSARAPYPVTVIDQENTGLSGARNAGLAVARGTWVSFPDPDDVLAPDYIRTIVAALGSDDARRATLVAANLVTVAGTTRAVVDDHPLRWQHRGGRRLVHLVEQPEFIHLAANCAVVRVADLREPGLTFDGRVRPTFEDAAVIARLFARAPDPSMLLVPQARYLYRRRADGDSLVQSGWSKPAKYDDQLRFGYLPLLEEAAARGTVPRWLQNTVLYDLAWYFKTDALVGSPTGGLTESQIATFHGLLGRVLAYIDVATISEFRVTVLSNEIRNALLAIKGALPALPKVAVGPRDPEQQLTRVRYALPRAAATLPFLVDGATVSPVHAKRRAVRYLGRHLYDDVIAWLPGTGRVDIRTDGAALAPTFPPRSSVLAAFGPGTARWRAIAAGAGAATRYALRDRARLLPQLVDLDLTAHGPGKGTPLTVRAGRGLGRLGRRPGQFQDCWLLMDRDTEAHDNAEHLYRYLRQNRPDINAWFVLSRTSGDWDRLASEGFRLLAYGSARHLLALTQCRELISSQVDHYAMSPPVAVWLRPKPWRFTWLQHGVTKDDLSHWLNPKPVSLLITTTAPEQASIVNDSTPYTFTTREAVQTGMPRHDALVAKARSVSDVERSLAVFMPTWRNTLMTGGGASNRRALTPGFWESEYAKNWLGLLASPRVHDAADAAGLELVLMPHPNMAPHIAADRLPEGVRIVTYADSDVQDVIARASHVITDYSSNAFDAALADRPVLYFQFDRSEAFGASHIYRRGYFDYERDGFGPVATTLAAAETALVDLIDAGKEPVEPYASRIAETFTRRDGRACERVVAAIEAQRRPHGPARETTE